MQMDGISVEVWVQGFGVYTELLANSILESIEQTCPPYPAKSGRRWIQKIQQ
jgi:hypothetical protein